MCVGDDGCSIKPHQNGYVILARACSVRDILDILELFFRVSVRAEQQRGIVFLQRKWTFYLF